MTDERLKRASDSNRQTRAVEDRSKTENRVLTDPSRLEEYRRAYEQPALPNLPDIPGYRTCWVSTQNTGDTPQYRMRLGWSMVTPDDIPGIDPMLLSMKSAVYEGVVGVNELVAMKVPTDLREAFMDESHGRRPNAEEGRIEDDMRAVGETVARASRGNARVLRPGEPGFGSLGSDEAPSRYS
jgi:hypothetical protein